ncbi:type VI secretion system Vgr family protein [Achromobacter aloeverae]|uniref:Type VI secretion system tip protein VgrG n=1 Tax=Achromobacter aloeverae TaxID=1750518 RepID=A0A4Q1HGJ3_9BURK|nr:type VI secretion system Vgr family protein [Achromobacter aloeverae]RXN86222.1 type VI secretion system tip protein VgrG [Achromobacter aloeverae]
MDTALAYATLNTALLTQDTRLLRVSTPLGDALVAERLLLDEGISRLFTVTLDCLSTSTQLDATPLLGREISIDLQLADRSTRRWHAMVTGVDNLGADGGLARYRIHGRPWLQSLALRRDSYLFQDKTSIDILAEIFADYPLSSYAFEVNATPPKRAIRTQYRESDLEFVQRILAEDGLAFRFVHRQGDDDGSSSSSARHQLVVFDAGADLPANAASPIRFHRSDATETSDTITRFHSALAVQSNVVTRSAWDDRALQAHAARLASSENVGKLPSLEDYDYDGHGRYADGDDASRVALLRLRTLEARQVRYEGSGTVRQLSPGETFEMTGHDRYGAQGGGNAAKGGYGGDGGQAIDELGREYTVLRVIHEAANNLGSQAAGLAGSTDLERGRYRNRFEAQPRAAAVLPAWRARPTAPEATIAQVVATDDAPISSGRDLRVKVQFPWQRGERPLAGGLAHNSHGDTRGNAPGSDASGAWLRVATGQAGPNWGGHHVPRSGTEVVVEFLDGDIDQPVIAAQLYNDSDLPPYSAGVDGGANHGGVLSGWHSQALDGSGHNQWLFDDTSGQLRMQMATSTAASQLNLGHLVAQSAADGNRGAWRGSGFELRSDAWTVLRSGQGMLLTSAADPQATATLATPNTLQRLRQAQNISQRLDATAVRRNARALRANDGFGDAIKAVDPAQDGKLPSSVNGQAANKAGRESRSGTDPVDGIDGARVVLDAPMSLNLSTPASAVLHATGDLHASAQEDVHVSARQTHAVVAGQAAGFYADQEGIRAIAAQSPVSLRAHTDALELLADQGVTVTSTEDGIEVLAKDSVTLVAAGASVTLRGGDIVFKSPGLFSVKGASHSFEGPASDAAQLPQLPAARTGTYTQQVVYNDALGEKFEDMPFTVRHKPQADTWMGDTPPAGSTERVHTEESQPLEYALRYAKFKFGDEVS